MTSPSAATSPSRPLCGQLLLAVETSCDETSAAIVDCGYVVRSNVVASQHDLHRRFGGVVPEIASRAHLRRLLPVIDEALHRAKASLQDVAAVAVVTQPGLVGSLLIGLTAAKTLALVLDVPLVPVNHLDAHLFACRMTAGREVFPAVGLVVSGGHTSLFDCRSCVDLQLLGSTLDDAAGEAFDKVASLLGLGYPGGPAIERAAQTGNPRACAFPRSLVGDERLDFSFSGLKTTVRYTIRGVPGSSVSVEPLTRQRIADVAASFQEAVVDVLVEKCRRALQATKRRTLCVGGGVAVNGRLRDRLSSLADELGIEVVIASPELCTDNAAMAAIAWEHLSRGQVGELDVDVTPGLIRRR